MKRSFLQVDGLSVFHSLDTKLVIEVLGKDRFRDLWFKYLAMRKQRADDVNNDELVAQFAGDYIHLIHGKTTLEELAVKWGITVSSVVKRVQRISSSPRLAEELQKHDKCTDCLVRA